MDSRIEELAEIIVERCDAVREAGKTNPAVNKGQQVEKYRAYNRIGSYAMSILEEIALYRANHPEEYK